MKLLNVVILFNYRLFYFVLVPLVIDKLILIKDLLEFILNK